MRSSLIAREMVENPAKLRDIAASFCDGNTYMIFVFLMSIMAMNSTDCVRVSTVGGGTGTSVTCRSTISHRKSLYIRLLRAASLSALPEEL